MTIADTTESTRISAAYAAATFASWFVVSQRYASAASTVVPSPAIAITVANTSKARITRRSSATWIDGFSIGSVTCRSRCQKLAPKTSAASLNSRGMLCSPATRMIMISAVERQISATTIVASSVLWSVGSSQMRGNVGSVEAEVAEDRVQVARAR